MRFFNNTSYAANPLCGISSVTAVWPALNMSFVP